MVIIPLQISQLVSDVQHLQVTQSRMKESGANEVTDQNVFNLHFIVRVFPQLFRVHPNFHECFYNLIETRRTCFLFLLENTTAHNTLLTLIIKM